MEFSMERFTSSLWSILCLIVNLEFLTILIARSHRRTMLEEMVNITASLSFSFFPLIDGGHICDEYIGNSRA